MKGFKLKARIFFSVVITLVLGYYGWRLENKLRAVRKAQSLEGGVIATNQRLIFHSESGIDIWGNVVHPLPPPAAERTAIFLLHGSSARQDLIFWHRVEDLLPKGSGIRLVAYCDGALCVTASKGDTHDPSFPIIQYGEVVSSQSLINADLQGDLILKSERWFQPRSIDWRALGRTPQDVVKEVLE